MGLRPSAPRNQADEALNREEVHDDVCGARIDPPPPEALE